MIMGLKATNKISGEEMIFDCSEETIATFAIANAEMLLKIALGDPDERIQNQFGGEHGILECIERYLDIYKWASLQKTLHEPQKLPEWVSVSDGLYPSRDEHGYSKEILILLEKHDGYYVYHDVYAGYVTFRDGAIVWYTNMHNNCSEIKEEDGKVVAWRYIYKPTQYENEGNA